MVAIIGQRVSTGGGYPSGSSSSGLGDAFSRIAAVLADPLTPAIKREQLLAHEDSRISTERLRRAIEGARGTGGRVDPYELYSAGVGTGRKADDLSGFISGIAANVLGAHAPETRNALTGEGKYNATPEYQQRGLDNQRGIAELQADRIAASERYKTDNTPINVLGEDGQPRVGRLSESFGQRPVLPIGQEQGAFARRAMGQPGGLSGLPQAEQSFVGIKPEGIDEVFNGQRPDGTTVPVIRKADGFYNANSGEREQNIVTVGKLTAQSAEGLGGSTLTNQTIAKNTAHRQALASIDRLDKALASPSADQAVGLVGKAARMFNDMRSQVEAVTRAAGGSSFNQEVSSNPQLPGVLDNIMRNGPLVEQARQLGIESAVLRSQIVDLAYTVAKAKDPSGRMSNQDVERAAEIIGASLMDPTAARKVLGELRGQLVEGHTIYTEEVNRVRRPGAAAPASAPTAAPSQEDPLGIR